MSTTIPARISVESHALLDTPPADTLQGLRDHAILATLLCHGIRREELCKLRIKDVQRWDGLMYFCIEGKGDKISFLPMGMKTQRLIHAYLEASGTARIWMAHSFVP
jgi:integrase/recombinase XerD